MHPMVHSLIGCEWGRGIVIAGDMAKCREQAAQRVVLHGGEDGPVMVQLCEAHRELVFAETTPRVEATP